MSGGCLTESNAVQLGVILATITVAFLVTTLPMTVVVIVKAFFESLSAPGQSPAATDNDGRSTARFILARTVCELLMYTNHSINFFLYCAAGMKFRRELAMIGRRLSRDLFGRPGSGGAGGGPGADLSTRRHNNVLQDLSTTGAQVGEQHSNVMMLAVITDERPSV